MKLLTIFNENSFKEALDYLRTKKDSKGLDGVRISELYEYLNVNKDSLLDNLYKEKYDPGIVEQYNLTNKKLKTRKVSKINSIDRLLERCIYKSISPLIEKQYVEESYAYRQGLGTLSAANKAKEYIENGYKYVTEIDFIHYFDNIDHSLMINMLQKIINDDKVLKLINKFIERKVMYDGKISINTKGLLQGSVLSPLLSNLYLTELDHILKERYRFIRYADDIKIFTHTKDEGIEALSFVNSYIKTLKLELNMDKCKVCPCLNTIYYGYIISKSDKEYFINKNNKKSNSYYNEWSPSALSLNNGHYHILEDGLLSKTELTLLFENEQTKKYYPVESIDSINTYANNGYNTGFFELMNNKRILVNMFNKYGTFIGSFIPNYCSSKASLLIKQVQIYINDKKRASYAKVIIIASVKNMLMNIKYYNKHNNNSLQSIIKEMKLLLKDINSSNTVDKILILEAKSRETYYKCFNTFLKNKGFIYTKRTRKPPKDPINALISFGNIFLYNRISSLIYRTRLDNRISFVHSSVKHREALCYDLSDIYKPLIVDRVIFTIINKCMIDSDKHFINVDNGGIYLNKEGKYIFIKELRDKLASKLTINNKQISYISLIRNDINSLIKSLEEDNIKLFKPYKDI